MADLLKGQCHCGAIHAALLVTRPAAELKLRSCQCCFCTRHGAVTVSDPNGRATFQLEPAGLVRYRFGTRTSTSLLCGICGMYAGAILAAGDQLFAVLNVRGLAIPQFIGRAGEPVDYDGETPETRTARRIANWTPAQIKYR